MATGEFKVISEYDIGTKYFHLSWENLELCVVIFI